MLVCGCAHRCQLVLRVVEISRAASCGSAASVMAARLRRMAIDVLRFHREAKDSAETDYSSRQARDWVARAPSTSCVGGRFLWYRGRVSFSSDGEVCVETLHSLRHIGVLERWVKRCVRRGQWGVLGRQEPGIQWLLWNRRGVCSPKVRSHRRVASSLLLRN